MTNRTKRVHPGVGVGDTTTDKGRRTVGLSGHVHDAGGGLRYEIKARPIGEGTGLAEPRDRRHDHIGLDCLEILIAQPPPFEHTGAEVLDHNIGMPNKVSNDLLTLALEDVEADTPLAAILLNM